MMAVSTENTMRYQLICLLPHLRRFARGLAKDPYKADDLVQEACERALTKLDRSAEELNLKSFLYRVIYNRWIDNLRRRKTRLAKLIVLSEQNKFKAGDTSTDDRLDVMLDLQGALDKLDNEHRAAIMLIGVVARARAKLSELLYRRRGESFRLKAIGKLGEENESEI
jgi:RNA polymerase sigma-70 factor (ECF subfamily)